MEGQGEKESQSQIGYTGYIDVGTRHLFFYFFESRSNPDMDDVIMWTNGGEPSLSWGRSQISWSLGEWTRSRRFFCYGSFHGTRWSYFSIPLIRANSRLRYFQVHVWLSQVIARSTTSTPGIQTPTSSLLINQSVLVFLTLIITNLS